MPRDKQWYIDQYNRNREYSDWIFDYEEIEEHVNTHKDLDSFAEQTPMDVELYSGELQLDKYKRYMRIGYK